MLSSPSDPAQAEDSSSQVVPVLCLLGVVALLSSITPTTKYVFQHSSLTFLSIASGRIVIGFLFLAAVTAVWIGKDCGRSASSMGHGLAFWASSASDPTSSPLTDCCTRTSRTTR